MSVRRSKNKKSRPRHSSTSSPRTQIKQSKKRVSQPRRKKPPAGKQRQSTQASQRLQLGKRVIADMLGDPSLSFTAAARKWNVDPRWLREHLGSDFQKDTSGHIRAKVRNRRHKTLYKPTATPGESIPVITKNKRERRLLGSWMAALNAAGRGDFSKMKKLPRKLVIGGVRLETSPKKVQEILTALAEQESPYEGLYRSIVRPS